MTPEHDPSQPDQSNQSNQSNHSDHDELPDVTLYVLGALAGEERDRVRRHIHVCRICTDELTRVAGLPGLLDRLNPGSRGEAPFPTPPAVQGDGQPPDEVYDQLLGRVTAQRARKKRLVVVGALAAAAVVIAVPTVALAARPAAPASTLAQGPTPPIAQQADFHPMALTSDVGPASATAAVQSQPWGSSITIQAVNWKPGLNVRLDVVTLSGETVQVGGWRSTGPGTTVCAATTWYPKDQLVQLQAVEDGGPLLASTSL